MKTTQFMAMIVGIVVASICAPSLSLVHAISGIAAAIAFYKIVGPSKGITMLGHARGLGIVAPLAWATVLLGATLGTIIMIWSASGMLGKAPLKQGEAMRYLYVIAIVGGGAGAISAWLLEFGILVWKKMWLSNFQKAESESLHSLFLSLKNDNIQIRLDAVKALKYMKDPRSIGPLANVIGGTGTALESEAIGALGGIHDGKATAFLIDFSYHTKEPVRLKAIQELGNTQDSGAFARLVLGLRSQNEGERIASEQALNSLTKGYLGTDALKWEKWWSTNKQKLVRKKILVR